MMFPFVHGIYGRSASTLVDGLSSFWHLNNDATDSHGDNDLTANGSPAFFAGIYGRQCARLNGTSYYTRTDEANLSAGAGDFSIACRVWFDELITDVIVAKSSGLLAANTEYAVYLQSGIIRFLISDGTSTVIVQATNFGQLVNGVWYDIVARYDSVANIAYLRVNDTQNQSSFTAGSWDSGQAFAIGATNTGILGLNGRVQDVGFWKRLLTDDEIDEYRLGRDYPFVSGGGNWTKLNSLLAAFTPSGGEEVGIYADNVGSGAFYYYLYQHLYDNRYWRIKVGPSMLANIAMLMSQGDIVDIGSLSTDRLSALGGPGVVVENSGQGHTEEISYFVKPAGATAFEIVGHDSTLVQNSAPTVEVDGSPVTPSEDQTLTGQVVTVTQSLGIRHTEIGGGATDIGTMTLVYTMNPTTGLAMSHTITWATSGEIQAYPCMWGVTAAVYDRYAAPNQVAYDITPYGPDYHLNILRPTHSVLWAWDSGGNQGSLFYIPDLAATAENFTKAADRQLFWFNNSVNYNKAYCNRYQQRTPYNTFAALDTITSEAQGRVIWFTGGANAALSGF